MKCSYKHMKISLSNLTIGAQAGAPAHVRLRLRTSADVYVRLHTSAYVRIRPRTSAYVRGPPRLRRVLP